MFTWSLYLGARIQHNSCKTTWSKEETIGIRLPDNPIVRALTEELGRPLASASLHHDDELLQYPTDPEEIIANYAHKADFVINGGWGDNTPPP